VTAKASSDFRRLPFEIINDDAFRILAIPYGGPMEKAGAPYGADLQGQWFSPDTDIKPDWFDQRPVLWHHGKDPTGKMGTTLMGKAINLTQEDDGWWVDFWWAQGEQRRSLVEQLGKKGAAIYGSSQSVPALAKAQADGHITVWPFIEETLSTVPVNHYSHLRPMKAVLDDYALSGIPVSSALKALLPAMEDLASDLVATEGIEPLLTPAMSERELRKLERLVNQLLEQVRRKQVE